MTVNFIPVRKKKRMCQAAHTQLGVCVFSRMHALCLSCAAYLRVCVAAYMWRSLNHGSCHSCLCVAPFVKACSVLSILLSVFAVNHKTACVRLCGRAEPDEVNDKSWPFGGPSLSPSSRLSINYSHSISRTNWCMDIGLSLLPCLNEGFLFFSFSKCPTDSICTVFTGLEDLGEAAPIIFCS